MNAIQTYNAICFYTDRTKAARYFFSEINQAVRDAIQNEIDSIVDTANKNQLQGIDRLQMFRDNLFTLNKPSTSTPTSLGLYNDDVSINHINYPTDYQSYAAMSLTVDGVTTYCRDLTYGNKGPQLECSFLKPSNSKPKFLEDSTGLKIYRGITGTTVSATLDYIKTPLQFYMGIEANVISAGAGVLALPVTSYTVLEDAVYNSVTYPSGSTFSTTGALQTLTSGEVILSSLLVGIDLPDKVHQKIAKMAAAILLGVTEDFESSGFTEKESQ